MNRSRRTIPVWTALIAVASVLALSPPAAQTGGATTTLDRTILDLNGDGRLEYAAGEPVLVREDLGTKASSTRSARRTPLLSFVGFTDFQVADEESVVRGPWADKCVANSPVKAAFRPQEAMVPHLINSNIRAAAALGGGPVTGRPFDFGIQLGDAADNAQRNEVQWFIDLLDGGKLIDPDSGDHEKYEGPQGAEPWPAQGGRPILELANDPFYAPGLRHPDGTPIPWYSVLGNHDAKVQGTIPNLPGWWEFIRTYSQGPVYVRDLAPDYQHELCANPALITDPAFWMKVLTRPGATSLVTADPDRIHLTRLQWMAEHLPPAEAHKIDPEARGSTGVPSGHGYLGDRCKDEAGKLLDRLCFSFDSGGIHFIVIDTNPDEGIASGNIDAGQLAWLERDLIAHSSRYYDENGAFKQNPSADDRLIAVFSHHTRETISEDWPVRLKTTDHAPTDRIDQEPRAFAEAFSSMLLRFPNVIMHGAGHSHENKIWARTCDEARETFGAQCVPGTGYWEVNSSSHADWPMQSRTIEIVDNRDGTLSLFGVVFDATASPKACRGDEKGADATTCLRWSEDATHERSRGAAYDVNEEYLASVGREVGYNDTQEREAAPDSRGRDARDRNVEMVIANPLAASSVLPGRVSLPATGGSRGPLSDGRYGLPGPEIRHPDVGKLPQPPAPRPALAEGLGVPSTEDAISGRALRGIALLAAALVLVAWLRRARVRARMLGSGTG